MKDQKFVSILCPSRHNPDGLLKTINSFEKTCTNNNHVEIIVKLDSDDDVQAYTRTLKSINFQWKILIYPRHRGLYDAHYFDYDLLSISSGKLLWFLCDDLIVEYGDWLEECKKSYDVFSDNIYVLSFNMKKRKNKVKSGDKFPIVSRKLVDLLGYTGLDKNQDRFFRYISKLICRRLNNSNVLVDHVKKHTIQDEATHNSVIRKKPTYNNLSPEDYIKKDVETKIIPFLTNQEINLPIGFKL